jgi:hypothetical protein
MEERASRNPALLVTGSLDVEPIEIPQNAESFGIGVYIAYGVSVWMGTIIRD